jgi:hypothetical protein
MLCNGVLVRHIYAWIAHKLLQAASTIPQSLSTAVA